jgi:DNA-binding CsgD family transcriptional regulator
MVIYRLFGRPRLENQHDLVGCEEQGLAAAAGDKVHGKIRRFGLTQRESEILSWVAQGKTNPEIGTILGISPRTVQKHLEQVYQRLSVEHRHAAMRMALNAKSWQERSSKSDF